MIYRAGRRAVFGLCLAIGAVLALPQVALAQNGPPSGDGPPRFPMTIPADERVEQKTYQFPATGEEMKYTLYVSSKVTPDTPAPLIVALHGLGGDSNFIVRGKLVDLAEEGGYIVVGPMGYNVGGWYGSPVVVFGGRPIEPKNLTELSELDVMTVTEMVKSQYNVDPDRVYLMGHSMGGAGTIFLGHKHSERWAALAAIAPAAFLMQGNQKAILERMKQAKLPLMITQGDQDTAVPTENTRSWAEAMKEVGLEHEYLEMEGRDHGNIITDSMDDIFRFFAAHKRPAPPPFVPRGRPGGPALSN